MFEYLLLRYRNIPRLHFHIGKLSITQLPHYAEKLQLMDNKPASGGAAAGGAVGGAAQPPQQLMTSQVSQVRVN